MQMATGKKDLCVPHIDAVKFVEKSVGVLKGYAVNTFHGLVKNYNEDRVSIIMNITKPNHEGRWPKCSYFGVFDGHGGQACSNFLKDHLHKFVTENHFFPHQPIEALKVGFKKAEHQFINYAESQRPPEKSGSCAIVVLIIDNLCYIANVGDSRAILSSDYGSKIVQLSNDHKPESATEKARIEKANGKIYQSIVRTRNGKQIKGPYRISPGKLSVSRSFGDIEAKIEKYGGNPKVLIAKPQITYFEINAEQGNFIIMGSDGVYDKLTNQQVAGCFWDRHDKRRANTGNEYIGEASSQIITAAMSKMSMDNLTSLVIVFEDNGRLDLPRKNVRHKESMSKQLHENSDRRRQNEKEKMKQKYQQRQRQRQKIQQQNKTNHSKENSKNLLSISQTRHNNENQGRSNINSIKSERGISSKLIEKMVLKKKNSVSQANEEKVSSFKEGKSKSRQALKKDMTMKELPYSYSNKSEAKEAKRALSNNALMKLLKTKQLEKLR